MRNDVIIDRLFRLSPFIEPRVSARGVLDAIQGQCKKIRSRGDRVVGMRLKFGVDDGTILGWLSPAEAEDYFDRVVDEMGALESFLESSEN